MLKKNRLFFKDFDGTIVEVPQKKIFVRTKELKDLKKLAHHGGASVYGENQPGINQLCKATNYWVKHGKPIETKKETDEEEARRVFAMENGDFAPGGPDTRGGGQIEEEPIGDEPPPLLAKLGTITRRKSQREMESSSGQVVEMENLGQRQRNKSLYTKPTNSKGLVDSPRSEPESMALLD